MKPYLSHLEWIDKQCFRLLDYVRKWSNINSFSENLEGLKSLAQILEKDFSILGGSCRSYSLPPRHLVNEKGAVIEAPLGKAISFKKRAKAPIQVLLAGHMDTVFPPSSIFQGIKEIDSGKWQGPGVADMKGGLAIMLIALEALERSPYAGKIGWEILINPDEELGSPGSAFLFEAAAKRNHIGMIFEPAFPDGAFVSRRKGSASYTLIIHGQAAHVGRDHSKGRNAIYALAELINKMELEQQTDKELIINAGYIEGGGPVNIVPSLAIARVNFRSSKTETIEKSKSIIRGLADSVELREGIKVEIVTGTVRFPKPLTLQTEKLFESYAKCAKTLDQPFALRETGGVCDGNILSHAGLPTMDSLGAIGGGMHTHEEYLVLSSLIDRSKLAALFLIKLAAGKIEIKNQGLADERRL